MLSLVDFNRETECSREFSLFVPTRKKLTMPSVCGRKVLHRWLLIIEIQKTNFFYKTEFLLNTHLYRINAAILVGIMRYQNYMHIDNEIDEVQQHRLYNSFSWNRICFYSIFNYLFHIKSEWRKTRYYFVL